MASSADADADGISIGGVRWSLDDLGRLAWRRRYGTERAEWLIDPPLYHLVDERVQRHSVPEEKPLRIAVVRDPASERCLELPSPPLDAVRIEEIGRGAWIVRIHRASAVRVVAQLIGPAGDLDLDGAADACPARPRIRDSGPLASTDRTGRSVRNAAQGDVPGRERPLHLEDRAMDELWRAECLLRLMEVIDELLALRRSTDAHLRGE